MVHPIIFGNHKEPGGIFIQPMHNSRSQDPAYSRQIPAVFEKAVNKGSGIMPGGGMDHQTRGFVQDEQRRIFIDKLKVNGFRFESRRPRGRDTNTDLISES